METQQHLEHHWLPAFPLQTWQHIAYVFEDNDPEVGGSGGVARLYRNGQITITWDSNGVKLQSTDDVSNPASWSDVAGATNSPFVEETSAAQKYYRVTAQ